MVKVKRCNVEGQVMTNSTGTALMDHVCMCNAHFTDGHLQPLYYPSDHPTHPGIFKGMAVLLEECGYHNACTLSQLVPPDKEVGQRRVRLGPAARLGPQPPGVSLKLKIAHGGIIGEILAKGK